jgi:hypothetical protein
MSLQRVDVFHFPRPSFGRPEGIGKWRSLCIRKSPQVYNLNYTGDIGRRIMVKDQPQAKMQNPIQKITKGKEG